MLSMMYPSSCDTFVVLPGCTSNNATIFGKNSDRPDDEIQDIVYYPAKSYSKNSKVNCTYVTIDQVPETLAVVLSKPNWMWGAEMGGNICGVCIGNEAIWGKVAPEREKKLLGMDFVRLGLERGKSAREALEVITTLLELHGQGGPCSNTRDFTYHNSYLIADSKEAWVLETVGKYWVAEHVTTGFRNISNFLSIESKVDLMTKGLKADAEKYFNWDPSTEFNFRKIFGGGQAENLVFSKIPHKFHPARRFERGKQLLCKYSENNIFDIRGMIGILRDDVINRGGYGGLSGGFATTSSQVSVLQQSGACHWFTGTPDAVHSIFKPFTFTNALKGPITDFTRSPSNDIQKPTQRTKHALYTIHERLYSEITSNKEIQGKMKALEDSLLGKYSNSAESNVPNEIINVFCKSVAAEIELYTEA